MGGVNDRVRGQDHLGLVLTGPNGEVKVNKTVPEHGEPLTSEFVITREFATANDFSIWVEKQHLESGLPRMEIIINYCDDKDIDIEVVAPLINRNLKEQIREEAEAANLMRKSARLP